MSSFFTIFLLSDEELKRRADRQKAIDEIKRELASIKADMAVVAANSQKSPKEIQPHTGKA